MPTNRHVGSRRDGRWAPMVGPYKVGHVFLIIFSNLLITIYGQITPTISTNMPSYNSSYDKSHLMHRTSNGGNSSNSNMGSRHNMSRAFTKFLFHFILLLHYLNGGGSSSDSGSHHHDEVLVDQQYQQCIFIQKMTVIYTT